MEQRRPKILITNDDGIHAPGIRHLWESLHSFADTIVVAPHQEQSGAALSLTFRTPLHIHEVSHFQGSQAWAVSGTPADCVKMALKVILSSSPDLVVSGINRGCNAGRNLLYSGTVGGVIEGVYQNIPGIAFSCRDYSTPDYIALAKYAPAFVKHVLEHPLPEGTFLNVNFPFNKDRQEKMAVRLARQGKSYWGEAPEKRTHPAGEHNYYWMGIKEHSCKEDADSDISLLKAGYITAVPISVKELTDKRHFTENKKVFEEALNMVVESSEERKYVEPLKS